MQTTARVSPRPLTDAERARIERAHNRIAVAEQQARDRVRRAVAERDKAIAQAVRAGAKQTDIAEALGLSRQAIHDAVKRQLRT
jgi:DNA-binding NarL/FixJ family response regulator